VPARRRSVIIGVVLATFVSGGSAWAANGGLGAHHSVHPDDGVFASDESTTSVEPSDDTTTSVGATTTTAETETTVGDRDPESHDAPDPGACKPGWGYGDHNHCHSGPPGQHAESRPDAQAKHDSHKSDHEADEAGPDTDGAEHDAPDVESEHEAD
jgi:hypothetical protein